MNSKYHPSNSLVSIVAIGTFEDALQVLDHKQDVNESEWMDSLNNLFAKADPCMVMGFFNRWFLQP
jgi:hypothetical protein